jgi:hypothetical protein
MSEFMFNRGDRVWGSNDTTFEIMAAFTDRGENYYAVRGGTGTLSVREESTTTHWKLIPKYEVGEIWLSADRSRAFMVTVGGRLPWMRQITGRVEGQARTDLYEVNYGPLVKWDNPNG